MALRFVENYPLDKGGTPDLPGTGVCGKYLQTALSPYDVCQLAMHAIAGGGIGKNGQAYIVSRRRSGGMGPFPLQKNFFQKRVDFA